MRSEFINKVFILCVLFLFMPGSLFGETQPYEYELSEDEEKLTAEFLEADVRDVIRTLGRLAEINLVLSEEVTGKISISLKEVYFYDAIRAIMDVKGLDYEKVGDIMRIAPFADIQKTRRQREEIAPLETEVFTLRYTNADKIEIVLKEFLSDRGSVTIYHRSIRGGWPVVGIADDRRALGPAPRNPIGKSEFPTMVVVKDTASAIETIRGVIETIDTRPKQILIEALIAEIRYDDSREIGIDWESLTGEGALHEGEFIIGSGREAGFDLSTGDISTAEAGFEGLGVTYTRLSGTRVRAMIRALERTGHATVLSSPRTLVLDGHEATVLVGLKHPIFETTLIGDIDPRLSESLSHYEPIGVLLRVVPAVWENDLVNLSVHPAVTALGAVVTGTTQITAREIITQEVDTNITVRSGDTVVIGGLIKDDSEFEHFGVPILSHLPVLGFFFRREREIKSRQELVIFITPTVLDDAELSPQEASEFREHLEVIEGGR